MSTQVEISGRTSNIKDNKEIIIAEIKECLDMHEKYYSDCEREIVNLQYIRLLGDIKDEFTLLHSLISSISDEETHEIDEKQSCRDCIRWCEHCGKYHTDNEYEIYGVGWVCENCRENYYGRCDFCDEYYCLESLTPVNNGIYYCCRSCLEKGAYYCEDCEEYMTEKWMDFTYDPPICTHCADDRKTVSW